MGHQADPGGTSQNSAVLGEGLECWHTPVTPWAIRCAFFLILIPIFLSFLFLSLLCDLQTFGIDTLIQSLWRTFPVTETWGLIHCQERRNNSGVVQGVVQWEGGGGAVQTNIAPFIPELPDMGQHRAQHCLNPSTAILLGTVVTVWLWKSVNFLPSLCIFSWKWNSTKDIGECVQLHRWDLHYHIHHCLKSSGESYLVPGCYFSMC